MRGYAVLDVGCGMNPKGDVNTDIHTRENLEIKQTGEAVSVDLKDIPNFIACSGEYLPFRNNMFDLVKSSHVIEHVRDPALFLRECKRVARFKIVVVCPHRYGRGAWGKLAPFHRHVFSSRSWSKTGYSTKEFSHYRCIPSEFIPLFRIPDEWTVIFYKRRLK